MPAQPHDPSCESRPEGCTVLTLRVRNHPGVMSPVCGLFARRAYNLEAILCMPEHGEQTSLIWLLVGAQEMLDQVLKQLGKLHDVLEVKQEGVSPGNFAALQQVFGLESATV